MSKQIFLSDGSVALVDEEDYYWLVGFNWHFVKSGSRHKYPARSIRRRKYNIQNTVFMHCEIASRMGLNTKDFIIDHIDRNTLNCVRSNLREATVIQNSTNSKLYASNKSGFRGVSLHRSGKYKADIKVNGEAHYLGLFNTSEEAAAFAYEAAAKLYFKEFIGELKS